MIKVILNSWWCWRKKPGDHQNHQVIRIHPLGTINVGTKFHSNLSNRYLILEQSGGPTDRPTSVAIRRAQLIKTRQFELVHFENEQWTTGLVIGAPQVGSICLVCSYHSSSGSSQRPYHAMLRFKKLVLCFVSSSPLSFPSSFEWSSPAALFQKPQSLPLGIES